MFVKTKDRKAAYDSVINLALKDPRFYCNNCQETYTGQKCCDEPAIGRNIDHCRAVIKECKELKNVAKKDTASFCSNAMRLGLKVPVFMYETLSHYEESHGEVFLDKKSDTDWFAKNYPQFVVPRDY